ncbi:MAG: hypothetical protein PHT44_03225 [Candidatus Portnoybacteria bacterium]|nr:hypothetical protein [Candidatus Portnoybacteria bacterium]MDD4982552.1 hypothetical protein [Candidatus Portnoybacteria bacterium]
MKKHFEEYKWILVFAALVALAAGIFTWQGGNKFSVSLSLTISRAGTQNAVDYKYDSYYALKASDEFGSAVAGWFKTPEMAQAIYKNAGLDPGSQNLAGLSRRFQAVKISPATVEVRFSAGSIDEAKTASYAIIGVAGDKANLLSSTSGRGVPFSVIGGEPVIIANSGDIWQNVAIGFFIGLIFGFFVKTGKEYFSE